MNRDSYIDVHQLGSGWAAVHIWWNPDGFYEPYDTGYGRYTTKEQATEEALEWAKQEGIECRA